MRRFGGWSLRARLTVLLLATLIPLAGVGGYWVAWEVRQKRANVQREAREVAEHLADHVGHLVAVVHEMLAVLARSLAVQTRDRREAERLFRDLLATSPHLENIGLLEPDGRVVATAVLLPPGDPMSFADREWLHRVVRSGQPAVGRFYVGRITGKPVAHVAHPMLDREGRVTAVLFADLRLAARNRAVTAGQPGPSLVWAIVDDKDIVLLHSNPEPPIGKPLGPLSGMLVGEATVPGTSWRAVAGIPEAAITSWVRQHLLLFALPALLILLLAAGIGFWIAYGTWRPLEELAEAVRRIGAGETGVALPVEGGGEVGEVTRAFQETLTALTRRRQELSALLQATQALAASLDLAQSLQAIAQQAAAISGAPAVRLFLLEGEPPVLRWRMGVGVPPEDEQHIVIPVGESFSGEVAATGKPLAVPDCRGDPRIRYSHYTMKYGLISYLGLPIKSEGRVVGVLVFNTEAPRSYSEAEISFLSAFADQVAIALENARLHEAMRQHAATLEQRVRERTAALEEALRVKAQFLATMSHELRTPLNFILGFAQLLQEGTAGPLTPRQAQHVDRIQKGGKWLLDLVSNILDLTLVETGRSRLQLEPVPLAPLVQEVLELFSVQASQKHLEMNTALDPGLPFVVADRSKLNQILVNLVGNAVKFTHDGARIMLTAREVREDQGMGAEAPKGYPRSGGASQPAPLPPGASAPTPWIELAVEDSGIGIKAEDLERIFVPFHQVDGSDSRAYGGAGLGLALVRTLVELHGGRVWAESEGEGYGARFVVRLPLLAAPPRPRVLVVEDEVPVLEALCATLAAAGYLVDRARTGAEALERLAAILPSLLVLDIGLPDVDGWEVLKQVRREEQTRTLPVLVLTGLHHVHAEEALALGADEFLAKPVSAKVLAETVGRLLRQPAAAAPELKERPPMSKDE